MVDANETADPPQSWFAGLRSKLSSLAASNDFLSSLSSSRTSKSEADSGIASMDELLNAPTLRSHASLPCQDQYVPQYVDTQTVQELEEQAAARSTGEATPQAVLSAHNSMEREIPGTSFADPSSVEPVEAGQEIILNILAATADSEEQPMHHDTLELQHFGSLSDLVPVIDSTGIGHTFEETFLLNPTWCDKCGDFVWGLFRQAVRCRYCQYTCHSRCVELVTLDCISGSMRSAAQLGDHEAEEVMSPATEGPDTLRSISSSSKTSEPGTSEPGTEMSELPDDLAAYATCARDFVGPDSSVPTSIPVGEELRSLIEQYNADAHGLNMELDEGGYSFRGHTHIHMNFTRPINVIAGETPQTLYDIVSTSKTSGRRTITSFFLPRNTVKVLYTSSDTTTREMIVALLRKFMVADNPNKFALYERDLEPGKTLQAKLTRLSDYDCPLRLALLWGSSTNKRLVLQENETGDIMWDAFEIPELQNFLRILDREEQLYTYQIQFKYDQYRRHLEKELSRKNGENESDNVNLPVRASDNNNRNSFLSDSSYEGSTMGTVKQPFGTDFPCPSPDDGSNTMIEKPNF